MYKFLLTIFYFCIATIFLNAQYKIIPEPLSIEYKESNSKLANEISIVDNEKYRNEINLFKIQLELLGYKVNYITSKQKKNSKFNIELLTNICSDPEGYSLELLNNLITISASESVGIFRGMSTVLQLVDNIKDQQKPADQILKNCRIVDEPRFNWRGLMFDVSRHFFSVEDVKKYIDQMAKYKFNTFHWHLTDDEGWRIEIKSMPKLTAVGAWRSERVGKFGDGRPAPIKDEPKTYGGFYTQDEIKDVVAYAKQRHITIVPEVDVPGHSMALLAAYPELSTKKEEKFVSNGFKFSEWFGDGTFKMLVENTLNPIDENVYVALDKIFGEVAALFPGQYIHVGGDESYHGYWEEDEACRKFMKAKGMKNGLDLQGYFMRRVEKIISAKNKKMIGWDEILYGGLADGAAVMSWRGMKGGIEAAKQGHNVVMTPTEFTYIDYTQGDRSLETPIYASLYLKKAYEFEPLPDSIDPKLILGGQANLWTEAIPDLPYAFYMTYPRAFATAETLWSSKRNKNYNNFINKVEHQFDQFDKAGISICKAVYDPIVKVEKTGDKLMCSLECETPGAQLSYTTNNTFPTKNTMVYSKPFELPLGEYNLRVTTFKNGKAIGRTLNLSREVLLERAK